MTDLLALVANAGDATIGAFLLAGDRLTPLATTDLPGASSTFAVDAGRDLVYAAVKGTPPAIVTLRLDRGAGVLTEVARTPIAAPLAYLDVTRDGGVLLGASYHDGVGFTWPVAEGVPGAAASRVAYAHLHCALATADGSAYFVSLGEDLVAQCALAADGTLTPLDPPTVALPAGSGPRHLVVAADSAQAYLTTEFSGEVIRLERAAGGVLTPRERVGIADPAAGLAHSRLGADPRAEHLIWGADLHLAGPWLLASERTAGTLASVPVAPDGSLGAVAAFTPTEAQPRGFATTPDGTRVLAVGERSTDLVLSRIAADGRLTELDRVETGRGANWVRVLPR